MFKELKEDVEKVKKAMYNKMEISVKRQKAYEKPKRNSEAENYSD
jgi:hypothetical protein